MNKIPFIIRDDDTCFFTKPEDIEWAYKDFYNTYPVTLAATPFLKESFLSWQVSSEFWHTKEIFDIGNNKELIKYLKSKIKEGKIWIALHGINHTYKVENHKITPEFLMNIDNLETKLKKAKSYLEKIFWIKINEFVPPSNTLSINAYKALNKLNFNLLNLPWSKKWFNRPIFSLKHTYYFMKRIMFLKKHWFDSPFPLLLDNHWELWSQTLTPWTDIKILKKSFLFCYENNLPFCLATHYWEHKSYISYKNKIKQIDILKEFLEFISKYDTTPMLASEFTKYAKENYNH